MYQYKYNMSVKQYCAVRVNSQGSQATLNDSTVLCSAVQ